MGNHPNPFNPSTSISYAINVDGFVSLKIYNSLGEEVASLVNEFQTAGYKSVTWNGRNDAGATVASGLYFTRLTAGNQVRTEKMMLMK
jgi:flagellar hook assembly protein FlgD